MDDSVSVPPLTFPVDPEHGGLRTAIFLLFFVVWAVGYVIVNALIPNDGLNIIAGLGGFGLAAVLVSQLLEPWLKQRWPSGRVLTIDERHVRLQQHGKVQVEINAQEPMSILQWSFKIKHRRNRVPAGWYVLAVALEQDDIYLPLYTLVSPDQAETLGASTRFTALVSEKDSRKKDPRQDTLRVAGEQRRLRLAETHRWADGAELSPEHFEQVLDRLSTQFPQWLPLSRSS